MNSAQLLVLDQGFAATSVDEVIAASSSSKGAFFHHFPTKNDLGRALLNRYAEADVAMLWHHMVLAEGESEEPGEQVLALIRRFEEIGDEIIDRNQSSCLYVSFVHDRELTSDGSTKVIEDAIVAWRIGIKDKLVAAAATRPQLAAMDLDALADHVFVTFEGAFILARATDDEAMMRVQLRTLRLLLSAVISPARARG